MRNSRRFFLTLVALLTAAGFGLLVHQRIPELNLWFRAYVDSHESDSLSIRLIYIGLQILQVLLFFLPGEVFQAFGGYAFGFWEGTYLTLLGIGLASMLQYKLASIAGKRFSGLSGGMVGRLASQGAGNPRILFLLYLLPGFPKDVLGYLAGLTGIGLLRFLLLSSLARLPGLLVSSAVGSNLYFENYVLLLQILVVAAVVLMVSLAGQEKLLSWVGKLEKNEMSYGKVVKKIKKPSKHG